MEGGQKSKISLESGLDVKSSDQLVPVSDPLFQHNRQRFQGSMLPTSLRYEHNGWACGWDVYEFEVEQAEVGTDPSGYTVIKQKLNDNPAYIFKVRSGTTALVQIWYNTEDTANTSGLSISHDPNDYAVVTLSGESNGNEYSITINVLTGEITPDEDGVWIVSESSYEDALRKDGSAALNLANVESWVQFNAAIIEAEDAKHGNTTVAPYYSCDGTSHVWKDTSGSGWEISYDTESKECVVNGAAAEMLNDPDADSGRLSVKHDAEYEGTVDLNASGSESYLQVYDLSVSQTSSYVSLSSSGDSIEKWDVMSSGRAYLYPTSSETSRLFISGYVPYWAGLRVELTSSSNGDSRLNEVSAGTLSLRAVSAEAYYLSGSYVQFYGSTQTSGASYSLWLGATECFSKYGVVESDGSGSETNYEDLYGTLTFCACVFNRIFSVNDTELPFTAGDRDSGPYLDDFDDMDEDETYSYAVVEWAPWLDGGSGLETKATYEEQVWDGQGAEQATVTRVVTADFEPGFYAPAKEGEDGYWYISIDNTIEGTEISIPLPYSPDKVIGEGEYSGYVRLEEPLAYYDQSFTMDSYSTSLYRSSVGSSYADSAGAQSVDLLCSLNDSYVQESDVRYDWGYTGYVKPYFRTLASDSDTRSLNNLYATISETLSDTYSVSFNSGPLSDVGLSIITQSHEEWVVSEDDGLYVSEQLSEEVRLSISSRTASKPSTAMSVAYLNPDGIIWSSGSYRRFYFSNGTIAPISGWHTISEWQSYLSSSVTAAQLSQLETAIIDLYRDSYSDDHTFTVSLRCFTTSRARYNSKYYYLNHMDHYSVMVTYSNRLVSLIVGGVDAISLSEEGEGIATDVFSSCGIAPSYAAYKLAGVKPYSASVDSACTFFLSLCYDGKFQSTVRLLNTDNNVLTSSNVSSSFSLSASPYNDLVDKSGFYIDRDFGDNTSSSLFGVEEFQVRLSSVSLGNSQLSALLYGCPVQDSSGDYASFYVFTSTGSSSTDALIPGHVYYNSASSISKGYNMSGQRLSSSYGSSGISFSLTGTAIAFYLINSFSPKWIAESGVHDFYSSVLPQAVSLLSSGESLVVSPNHYGNGSAGIQQYLSFYFNGEQFRIEIDSTLSNGSMAASASMEDGDPVFWYNGYPFEFSVGSCSLDSGLVSIEIVVSVPLEYLISARLPFQLNYASSFLHDDGKYLIDGESHDDAPVGSYATGYADTSQKYSFETDGGVQYSYSGSSKELSYGTESFDTEAVGDARKAEVQTLESLELSFILEGPYKTLGDVEIVSLDGESMAFRYGGQEYSFDISALLTGEEVSRMKFMYTDTRDPAAVPESVAFAVQNTESEYQFLRQQWNTLVEVENYWWIDENTILELNKTSLVVKRKVSSFDDYDEETDVDIDDWGGDAWEAAYSFDRGDYIDNTVARYGVTCAYGGAAPRFWTVKVASRMRLTIDFYELEGSDRSFSFRKQSITVPVNVVSIGSQLNASEGSLNTYSQLSAEAIAYEATYSGTVIGEHVLFGIHHDNNFNQWALDIYGGSLNIVVQGYGYVGLDGSLTGGEIPLAYFDTAIGFSGTVLPIDEIEQEDMEYVSSLSDFTALEAEGKVIGDEIQQWYIAKRLSGIVSHLTWGGESWSAVSLPISNTYSCVYGSPSYGRRIISDHGFWGQNLSSLLPDDSLSSIAASLVDLLTTKIYGYSPKVTYSLYLQQTMGQYAYVHYNSATPGKQKDLTRENDSENPFSDFGYQGSTYTKLNIQQRQKPEPIDAVTAESSDDFSFNLHGARQSVTVEKPWSGSFGIMPIIMSICSSAVQIASEALSVNLRNNQVSANDMGRRFSQIFLYNMDNLATLDKTITGTIPTLQSAVGSACTLDMFYSTCEGQEISAGPGWVQHNMVAQCVSQSVTSCQWELQQVGMLWIVDGLGSLAARILANTAKSTWEVAVSESESLKEIWSVVAGTGTNPGAIGSAVTIVVAGALYIASMVYLSTAEISETIARSICGGSSRVDVLNTASKHTYDVEGKHKYGQKSEVFMWPCFGVVNNNTYTDETVSGTLTEHEWKMHVPLTSGISFFGSSTEPIGTIVLEGFVPNSQDDTVVTSFNGDIRYLIANAKGSTTEKTLPSNMAVITGSDSFLPPVPFRNENIGVSEPVFPTSCFQDYIIDDDWELSRTASESSTQWISCKDTKLIDGDVSNIVVSDDFCGVACPYTAIEVKRGCEQKYVRPWAITPNALALNQTGYNCCYERKAYHAFDGYGQRYVKWCGARGMNKEGRVWHYAFIVNDRFKRSNKLPVDEFIGNFRGDPVIAMKTTGEDWVFNHCTDFTGGEVRGLEVGTIGEDKDARRYAAPVFAEFVASLPATLKTTSSFTLSVVDGITSLTSDNTDKQHAYKAPVSVDFAISKDKYRFTDEYISKLDVDPRYGVTTVEEEVPTLGLSFLGATPYEAYLYSNATRQYYTYAGGGSLNGRDTLERFRNVESGVYDFVQQEVAVPCVATFERLDKHVHDDWDERDNRMVPRLKDGHFIGEVWPPTEPIYNNRSGFRLISLPSGLCYQGPNRCVINRFVYSWYMKEQILENYGKWKKVPRERYHPFRTYEAEYERVDENVASTIIGWTHNPFLLVTSPLGVNSETDCVFEWEITFAWPVEMDELYSDRQYACVNVMGECFTPGGKVIPDRPSHVFLWRDLFTRTGNYGYYSYRYQSRCGAGNRERLHIWSDQYIAVSGLQVEVKPMTEKRTEILTQQVDVQDMEEI